MGAAFAMVVGLPLSMLMSALAAADDEKKIVVPEIPGLDVKVGQTVVIHPGVTYPTVFRFVDGRISVRGMNGNPNPEVGKWSTDGGRTWRDGPAALGSPSIELESGEVLSFFACKTKKRADGKYTLLKRLSLDGWKTITEETGVLDIPRSVPCGGDTAGRVNDGFIMDHGILRLKHGRLMASMYGNYGEDETPGDDYPASCNLKKYRTILVFSSDKGKTWGNPVTVATAPKVAQEGVCEADLARAANGDILCVMRSGGGMGKFTPCYLCRSTDEGQTWSEPRAILDRGVWPHLCVMRSGIIVCSTGRPGNWLVFSKDDGRTWQGAFCIYPGPSSSYTTVLEAAPDTILVIYDRDQITPRQAIVGTFFTVRKK